MKVQLWVRKCPHYQKVEAGIRFRSLASLERLDVGHSDV